MEWPRILNISLISFIFLFVYPFVIITITKLIKQRRKRYFIKRRPSLVFTQVICIAISNCILQPIILFNHISINVAYFENNAFLSSLTVSVISLFDNCFVLLIGFIMLIRIYLVNYDYEIQKEAVNYEWKNVLVAYNDRDINFYTSHKSTYGSLNWLIKRFSFIFVTLCSILFLLQFIIKTRVFYIQLAFSLIFLFEIIGIIFIWFKFKGIPNDKLYIGKELKECTQYCLFCIISGIILIICAQIFYNNIAAIEIFMAWIQVLLLNGLAYLSIIKVIQRCSVSINIYLSSKPINDNYKSIVKYSMKEIISTQFGFEAFINFLVSEFSSESLIFLTEFMQIKQSLHLTRQFEESVDCKLHIDIPFINSKYTSPLDIEIIDPNNNNTKSNNIAYCHHFMNVINNFYEKYIYSSAPYEINISYALRLSLSMLLDDRYNEPILPPKKRTFSRSRSITLSGLLSRRKDSGNSNKQDSIDENEKMTSINEKYNRLNRHKQILKNRNDLNGCISIILPLLEQCCIEIIPLLLGSFSRFAKTNEYYNSCKNMYARQQKIGTRISLNKQIINSKSNNNNTSTRTSLSFSALIKSASSLSRLSIPKLGFLSSQSSLSDNDNHFNTNDIQLHQCLSQQDETKEEEEDGYDEP